MELFIYQHAMEEMKKKEIYSSNYSYPLNIYKIIDKKT